MSSQLGKVFKISTFGESHGAQMGVVIDGCPAGLELDFNKIQDKLNRRKPGQSSLTSSRKEPDQFKCVSGIENYITLGSPITLTTDNKDAKPNEYQDINKILRPSHADFSVLKKYGIKSSSGGGRLSARETWGRVAAGAIAEQAMNKISPSIETIAFISSVAEINANFDVSNINANSIQDSTFPCPDMNTSKKMKTFIQATKDSGDSCGGTITCIIKGVPQGLGEPVFDKFEALLAHAMLSLPATKSFEIGSGINGTKLMGSEHNDPFTVDENTQKIRTSKNASGGIQGGISNGELIYFKVGFKPPSTIFKPQTSVDLNLKEINYTKKGGRHDPCVLPRAVVIIEAMAELVTLDLILRHQNSQITKTTLYSKPLA